MTVRWKPLLILSGLFVVVGLVGLMTIATVMGSRGTEHLLTRARAERKAGEFDKAKIDYQQVLKSDGRNAKLHEEAAGGNFREDLLFRLNTVEINLPYVDYGYRISFFGDEVDSIESFDINTGKRIGAITDAAIFPANLYLAPKDIMQQLMPPAKAAAR